MPSKQYWLMKSEPDTFSIDDLAQAKNQTTFWEGVRNYQARNTLRDSMKVGDLAFFYHSSCKEPAIVGVVKITRKGYPDVTAFDPKSSYYDPKSKPSEPRWYGVDVQLVEKLARPLTLSSIRAEHKLADFKLLQKGNRLSVFSVTNQEWQILLSMHKRDPHDLTK